MADQRPLPLWLHGQCTHRSARRRSLGSPPWPKII